MKKNNKLAILVVITGCVIGTVCLSLIIYSGLNTNIYVSDSQKVRNFYATTIKNNVEDNNYIAYNVGNRPDYPIIKYEMCRGFDSIGDFKEFDFNDYDFVIETVTKETNVFIYTVVKITIKRGVFIKKDDLNQGSQYLGYFEWEALRNEMDNQ